MAYLKSEISQKNKYWLSKHRYLELKHYCLQYPEWKRIYNSLQPTIHSHDYSKTNTGHADCDPTGKLALLRAEYSRNIELVDRVAAETDDVLSQYILKAVTEEKSFPWLKSVMEIPCERDMYYDRYRKFYWLLSQEKGL
jgi:hypothetical protein